jgi:hypothetical protein
VIAGSLLLILVAVALLAYGLLQGSNPYLIGSVSASLLAAVALIAGGRQAARAAADDEQPAGSAPDAESSDQLAGEVAGEFARDGAGERSARRRLGRQTVTEESDLLREPANEPVEELVGAGRRGNHGGTEMGAPAQGAPAQGAPAQGAPAQGAPAQGVPAQGGAAEAEFGRSGGQLGLADDIEEYDDDDDPPDEPPPQLLSPADAARVARMSDEVLVIDGRPRYHREGCVHLLGRQIEPLPVSEAVELGFTPCSRCEPDSKLLAQARRV